ncbi:MAG: TnpV protein [Clostridia bacterium]|nr:TnpV protein [Clostridia bacterium]
MKTNNITYRRVGDYYLPDLKLPESKDNRPIGKWGQLHLKHLKNHCKSTYYTYLMNGTLHDYLCCINDRAEEMFNRIVSHMAEADGTDENLKATDQMKWVGLMNNYRYCAEEIVFDSIIYT